MSFTKRYCLNLKDRLYGFERSRVDIAGKPYLDRWIIYFGLGTLRLHKFWRGDDDRASHTHPWWFWTFPLSSYAENVFSKGTFKTWGIVERFRWHYRPANYEHVVVAHHDAKPWWTIVISGHRINKWGFYPAPGKFVPWREYK